MKPDDDEKSIEPCFMCRQPTTEDYHFTVSWEDKGKEEQRHFCGSRCLRDWAEMYSESVKLYSPSDP